jgi:hypothetical protein
MPARPESSHVIPAGTGLQMTRFTAGLCGLLPAAILFIGLFSTVVFGGSGPQDEAASLKVHLHPNPVVNGHVLLVLVDSRPLQHPLVGIQAKYGDRIIPVFGHPLHPEGLYIGLVGISYYSRPGTAHLKLEWTDATGYHHRRLAFSIVEGRYPSEKLRVSARKVIPLQSDLQRIKQEKSFVKKVYAISQPRQLWYDSFQRPVDGKITSPYGARRTYNGQTKRYHSGVDFRAPIGTPIKAANSGVVRMARDLFFAGKHVVVDHGKGLYTSYSHLSAFRVTPGQLIQRGDVVGLAGASGRVNGPHLHWGAKLNGININPMQLLDISEIIFTPGTERDPITARWNAAPESQ